MHDPRIDSTVLRDLFPKLPFSGEDLAKSESLGELGSFVQWFDQAMEALPPGTAWHLGQQCDYRSRGVLGEVVVNAGSLGSGLQWLCRFYSLIQDATSVKLDVKGDIATLSYQILDPNIWPRHQDALYTLGVFSSLINAANPKVWSKVRVLLECSAEEARIDLSRIVRTEVAYNSQTNAISFPAELLNSDICKGARINQQHMRHLSALLAKKDRSMSVVERARYVILSNLIDSNISQETVAASLGLSSRTLRRKLAVEGSSYRELLDEGRMQLAAREFINSSDVSLSQMALKLGYSEHSTFTRAFGRWAGMAPKHYRNSISTANA